MTAAEQLRAASETLRRLADGATPGPWSVHMNPSRLDDTSVIAGRPGDPTYLAHYAMPQTAALIALMGPDLARMLAAVLEATAHEIERRGVTARLKDGERAALALAEHINERTSS